ncbi:MAG TPA: GtrA family protein [Solirubrobacterales bacterium]|nr:GtrA family protein [Solirubrobacterales bacterium]
MSDGEGSLAVRLHAAARQPQNWVQLLKFGVVGGSGYLINLGVFAFLSGNLGVYHAVAAVGAFCVAVTSNFLWNRYWTFGPGEGLAHMQAARFLAVSVACLVINLVVLEALVSSSRVSELAAQAIAVAVAMPFNFLGNKLWTFT